MHTTAKPVNFPAFPFPGFVGNDRHPPERPNTGLSFRDHVAVTAMRQLVHPGLLESSIDDVADMAYDLADAMLASRDSR